MLDTPIPKEKEKSIYLAETVKVKDGGSVVRINTRIKKIGSLLQYVAVRLFGERTSKGSEEINVVRRLCGTSKPHLQQFENDKENSETDVIATNGLFEKERFQVTKLYEERFWKTLFDKRNDGKIDDFLTSDLLYLIDAAVQRKSRYDKNVRLVLAIDTWPGISVNIFHEVCHRARGRFIDSGFKEIWLVGEGDDTIYRIL